MKPSWILFLKRFYGNTFNREFGREGPEIKFKRTPCTSLEKLGKLFKQYQKKKCNVYASVYNYDHNHMIPPKKPNKNFIYPYGQQTILDRIFLDFDKDLSTNAKKEYDKLILPTSKIDFYRRLIEQGQAQKPIKETKEVYYYIKSVFGGDPLLVFSGAKGCHLYIFFEPVKLKNPKETIIHFINTLKTKLNLKYLDNAVIGDFSRVSRIPTSKHLKTGLYSHPWKHDYTYDEIIQNSKQIQIPFDDLNIENAQSDLKKILYTIDDYINKNNDSLKYQNNLKKLYYKNRKYKKTKISIRASLDVLKLNQFPCFANAPYTHDLRLVLTNICYNVYDLSINDTIESLRIFAEDKGYYDKNKHLNSENQIKALKKYNFTCKSMKKYGLCKYSNKKETFCGGWFYLKLKQKTAKLTT